ncbi:MAG: hypothetical protein IJ583_01115 [Firmicutes bacterium]|nr:hypothetical protein [Bacillota bacterium]
MSTTRKAINFDLDTNLLKKYYPKKTIFTSYTKAYKDIKNYLQKQGFSHRQGSGYVSELPIEDYEVLKIVREMSKKFTWLSQCVKQFDVTEIGMTYDMTQSIHDAANLQKAPLAKKKENTQKNYHSDIPNYRKRLEDAQKNKGITKTEKPKTKNKNEPSL